MNVSLNSSRQSAVKFKSRCDDGCCDEKDRRIVSSLQTSSEKAKREFKVFNAFNTAINAVVVAVAGTEILARAAYRVDQSLNIIGLEKMKSVSSRLKNNKFPALLGNKDLVTFVPKKKLKVVAIAAGLIGALSGYAKAKDLIEKSEKD